MLLRRENMVYVAQETNEHGNNYSKNWAANI